MLAFALDSFGQTAHFSYAQLALSNGLSAPSGIVADARGNVYVADTGNNAVKEIAPGCILASCTSTLASGFNAPSGMAIDASGDLFVADTGNNAVKEIVAVNGAIPASPAINTLGSGFSAPAAIALDSSGNVYVAGAGDGTVKEILASGGYATVKTLVSGLTAPSGIAVDGSGNLFLTDSKANNVQEVLAVSGSIPASPTVKTIATGFSQPAGIAVDADGDLFVADSGNGVVKELMAVSGVIPASPSVLAYGTGLGTPTGVALGANGALYSTDPAKNNAVVFETQAVNLGAVSLHSASGTFSLVFNITGSGALGTPGLLSMGASGQDFLPISYGTTCKAGSVTAGSSCILKLYFSPQASGVRNGAAVLYDSSSPANVLATVYLTGAGYGSLAAFPPGIISTIAGNGTPGFTDNLAAASAELDSPSGIAFDGSGNLYIADSGNGRIRMVSASTGAISTIAGGGSGCAGQSDTLGDGCPAASATLSSPAAIALDGAGNLYIADTGNQRIRVVNASTGILTTFAGGGSGCANQADSAGDGCPAASATFSSPTGIAVDGAGNLIIADTGNNSVRMVASATGLITEVAAVANPTAVAVDNQGNVYVAESSSALVQEVNLSTGAVTTVAGGGIGCAAETDAAGDGCAASQAPLFKPTGLALDAGFNLYIADQGAGTLRAVSAATGLIATLAGGGTGCAAQTDTVGDGCASTSATLAPGGLATDIKSNLYVADSANQRIREVDVSDPPAVVFPDTHEASTSATIFLTAESVGKTPLNLDGYGLYGANFNIDEVNSVCSISVRTLAPGATCTFGLIFTPRATGPLSSTIIFSDDAPGLGQSFAVSGNALAELTPPAPTITSSPATQTIATFATFAFADAENGVGYNCSLNTAPYSPCTNPMTYTGLTPNTINTFWVEAVDSLGTYSAGTPYVWKVVAPPPIPTITNGPASTTTLTTAFITFTDSQNVTYLCSLDSAAFAPCTSGVSLSGLAVGNHTYAVEAEAGPGILSGTVTVLWTINPPPPPTPVAAPSSATAVNFGAIQVGQTSPKSTLTFTFSLGGTVASINALTQGEPSLDFAALSSGSCAAGQSYTTGASCTVDATFTPKYSGTRYGAIVLEDAYGNVIGTGYLQGSGTGPQVAFLPYTQTSLGGGFATPSSISIDGGGNIYVADGTDALKVIPAGCASASCVTTLGAGFMGVNSVAVDGAGNVFALEYMTGSLLEIAPGCASENCVQTLSTTLTNPQTLAIDASGNLFVADAGPQASDSAVSYPNGSIKEYLASSGYATEKTITTGINFLTSVAVDATGNLFFAIGDSATNSAVEEIPAAGGYTQTNLLSTGYFAPSGLQVDAQGNLFVIDFGNSLVRELFASSNYTTTTTVVSYAGLDYVPYGIALDGAGNLYTAIPAAVGGGVFKLDYADPPALSYSTTSVGLTDTTDGTLTVTVGNLGNAVLNLTTVTPPTANFTLAGGSSACAGSSTIAAGASCTLGIQFAPTAAGTLTDAVTLTDNSLNATSAKQKIALSGTSETNSPPPAPSITAQPANPSGSALASFSFSDAQSGVTFLCSLDGAAYAACTTPASFSSLLNGSHSFGVRAADAMNNLSTITSYTWTVSALPIPTIDEAPANPTTATTAAFTFSDSVSGGSFVCSLDGAAYSTCTNPASYSPLALGSHTFAVEVEDGSGMLSAPATWSWTVATSIALAQGAAQDFGTVPVGQTSITIPLSYTFTSNATLGAPVALTEGAPNLDFAITGGSCVSGASFAANASCTINVTFTPPAPGLRRGAILLTSNTGATVAELYVHGVGSGPQVLLLSAASYSPGSETAIGGGFSQPEGVAVDGAGNVYVANYAAKTAVKIPAGCASASCTVTLASGLNGPWSIAVDGGGNVYVGELDPSEVREIPFGCTSNSCTLSLGGGFFGPQGIAVDGAGNVYVADNVNNAVKKIPVGCATASCVLSLGSGFIGPEGVAVDAQGNVFVVQFGLANSGSGAAGCNDTMCISNTVALMEIPAASGYATVKTLQSGFNAPIALALDGNANAYITEWSSGVGEVQEWTASSGYTLMQPLSMNCGGAANSFCSRAGVAVDASGNVYTADSNGGGVYKLNFAAGQTLSFPTATVAGQVDFTDYQQGVFVLNNGNAPLNLSSISASTNFLTWNNADPCTTSTPLAPGTICTAFAAFTPTASGPLTGTLTLTDNNLNAGAATQQVALSATGLPPAPTISTAPANGALGTTAAFTFTDTDSAVTSYLCSLDGAAYAACASGVSYTGIAFGVHTFKVEAQNSYGNVSAAATWTWEQIIAAIPNPVLTSPPSDPTLATTATFTFTDAEPGVSFVCELDYNYLAMNFNCISGVSYTGLALGSHTFTIWAYDAYGNASGIVNYTWHVMSYLPNPLPTTTAANFGTEAIGQTTAAQTLTLSFTSFGSGTLGSIQALTHGAPNLDFALAPGGTCAVGAAYSAGSTCTVNATFTPTLAGYRRGGVVIQDTSGNTLAIAYIQGVGSGPQIAFLPGIVSTYISLTTEAQNNGGFTESAMSADGAGNIYLPNWYGDTMQVIPAGCHQASCVKTVPGNAWGTTVDGAGNLILGGSGAVMMVPPGCFTQSCQIPMNGIDNYPYPFAVGYADGVFIDGAGNLYIADAYNYSGVNEAYAADGYSSPVQWGGSSGSFGSPRSIAVDVNGNMFVAAAYGGAEEIPAGCTDFSCVKSLPVSNQGYQGWMYGMAMDGAGNAYFENGGTVYKSPVATNYTTYNTVAGNLTAEGMGADDLGNLYLPNYVLTPIDSTNETINTTIQQIDFNTPPTLTFATSTTVGSTDSTDGALTATINNNGNGAMTFTSFALSNPSFVLDSATTTCSTTTPLAAQTTCTVGVKFAPTSAGSLSGTLIVTDNSLNAAGTQQLIPLAGTATGSSSLTVTTTALGASASTAASGASVTFTATVSHASGSATPTGTVTFMDGTAAIGAGPLNSSGVVTLSTANLAIGAHSVMALYGGDSHYAASSSAASSVTINQATTASSSTVSASAATIPAGGSLTLLATVASATGIGAPTGSVTFYDGATSIGTGTLNSNGQSALTTTTLAAGSHSIKVAYGGDTTFTVSTSAAISVTVRPVVATTTALQSSTSAAAKGSFVTFTATVTAASGSIVPTGTLAFMDGSTQIGGALLDSSGAGAISVNSLAVGAHSITAVYSGDIYDTTSTSAAVSLTVATTVNATTTQLSANAAQVPMGGSLTLTAAVTTINGSGTPTGSVTFLDGATTLCSGTLNAKALATCTPSFSTMGAHTLTASYSGDTANLASSSSPVAVSVVADPSIISLAASTTSIAANNAVTFVANVRPQVGSGTPTGTVTFFDGTTSLGSGTLSSRGSATLSTSALAVGLHTITASYGGDTADAASASGSLFVNVTILSTTTELAASAATVNPGASVTFTASVTPSSGSGTPTGSITFLDGSTALASVSLNASSAASYSTSALAAGSHSITASYSGDAKDSASTSSSVALLVSFTAVATTTTLQASSAAPTYGNGVSFTATVTPASGASVPTGSVTFLDGSATLGTGALNASGVASFSTSFLAVGAHSITASYAGDTRNNSSASAAVSVTVAAAPAPVLSLTPAALSFSAASGTTSAVQYATLTNTGNAQLNLNAIALLGANAAAFKQSTTCGGTLAAGASCSVTLSFAPTGVAGYSATLSVADNASGAPHTVVLSGTGVVLVAPAVSVSPATLTFSAFTGATSAAQSVTLSNTGNGALSISGISITGDNASSFAQTNNCGASLAAASSCNLSVTFSPAAAGSFSASLSIADNASGSPHTVALSGAGALPPTFTLTSSTPAQTVSYGGTAAYTITVTPQNGAFNNSISFTTSGLPSGVTATFSPSTLTPGSSAASTTLTLTAPLKASLERPRNWPFGATGISLAALAFFFLPAKRRRRWITLALLLAASLGAFTALSGCGGGFALPGPLSTTYSVTVTASGGSVQQSTTIQLTVK